MKKALAVSAILALGALYAPEVHARLDVHDPECFTDQNLSHQRADATDEGLTFHQWLDNLLKGALGS